MINLRFIRIVAFIVFSLLSCGCGTTKQMVHFPEQSKHVEESGKGRIYLIGKPFLLNIASHGTTVSVIADDTHIGYIAGHRYLCWERVPGISTITAYADQSKSTVDLKVDAGAVYYVIAHVSPDWSPADFLLSGGGKIAVTLEIVDNEKGRKSLLDAKPPEGD
ncbi:hypothetical protein KP004_04665 [Geomonas oryzisoli]|uniref:DUF2846 domain-containing protein n=1 Tax=Geomonas oryzisoli TaxID=2847992 RepID=A0ABX8J9H8_9BACT|nr:hypothetical protein [Geomonas oryzisoli]QWV94483.1 hypothetical protein KP004_04665 [Geomonas oryzisoli]